MNNKITIFVPEINLLNFCSPSRSIKKKIIIMLLFFLKTWDIPPHHVISLDTLESHTRGRCRTVS